jgi:phosphonate transport system permease protein
MAEIAATRRPMLRLRLLRARWPWGIAFLVALIWALGVAGAFDRNLVNARGFRLFNRFWAAALSPNLDPAFLAVVIDATFQTLSYAVLGIAVSIVIGVVGGLLSAEIGWRAIFPPRRNAPFALYRIPFVVVRAILVIPRAIHEVILGLFLLNIFGLHPLTAILAIGLHFGAVTAKVFSEILDETPQDTFDAIRAAGAPPLSAFFYGLLPRALPNLTAYGFYRFECAIRSSAILGVIGAGGLGYQIYLSLQSINYNELWTLFYALILLSGLTDLWSSLIRRSMGSTGTRLCVDVACGDPTGGEVPRPPVQTGFAFRLRRWSLPLFGALSLFSLLYVRPDPRILTAPRTQTLFAEFVADLFPPRLDANMLETLLRAAEATLAMSIIAMTIAAIGGMVLAFPAARSIALPGGLGGRGGRAAQAVGIGVLLVTRTLLLVLRAIPASIWALVCLFILYPGIFPGAVALGLYTVGILGRLMSETVENLDERPLRAIKAGGATRSVVFLYGVLPSAIPQFVSYIFYRWEVCIRETVIVGLVGAGGFGRLLAEQQAAFDYRAMAATLIGIMALTFAVDLASNIFRRALNR